MVTLERWQERYADDFYNSSNCPELYRNMSDGFPRTPDACRKTVQAFSANTDDTMCVRAIVSDGTAVGSVGAFLEKDVYCKNAEIAYWLKKDLWGRGVMTRILVDFTDYLFENHDLERLYARPFGYNAASQRALEKAGFIKEGVLRRSVFKDGKIHDAVMYAKLR